MHECCQHYFRGCRSGRSACQCSDHTPHTATSRFAWPSSQKEASWLTKKPANSLLKTTWPRTWITGTMPCGLMSLRALFDSDGVQHVWRRPGEEYQENCTLPTVKRGVVTSWSWAAWLLLVLGSCGTLRETWIPKFYCDILKQKRMSSLQKLCRTAVFQHNFHPKHTTKMTLPCWWSWSWRWWSGQVCLQTWTPLRTCGASSSGRWRSTMCLTSTSSVMSLWRSGRGCQQQPVQLWWITCPGELRQG